MTLGADGVFDSMKLSLKPTHRQANGLLRSRLARNAVPRDMTATPDTANIVDLDSEKQ
jgi:hypothetical protein